MPETGLIRPHHTKLAAVHKLVDAAIVVACYVVFVKSPLEGWAEIDVLAVLLAIGLFYKFAKNGGIYDSWRIDRLGRETRNILSAWFYTVIVLMLLAGVGDVLDRFRTGDLWAWAFSVPVVVTAWHFVLRTALRQLRRRGFNTRTVGIVGLNELGLQLADNLRASPWLGFELLGFFDDRKPETDRVSEKGTYPLLGSISDLLDRAYAKQIDVVFIVLPFQAEKRVARFINELRDTTAAVFYAQDFGAFEILHGRSYLLGNVPIISVHENPFNGISGITKRVEDIVLASLITLLIAIPALVITFLVKRTSPGPALFKQRRYGLDGREIRVWKFRTMTVADDGDKVVQASRDDPRVTRFGRFLRRTSLDELPQFINVLTGEMSIVGPRPHAVAHNEEYRKLVKSYMLRHKVKPGITGLAQLRGWRGETETLDQMQRRVECDLEYIRTWSVWLDLKIIVRTVLGGFSGSKAY